MSLRLVMHLETREVFLEHHGQLYRYAYQSHRWRPTTRAHDYPKHIDNFVTLCPLSEDLGGRMIGVPLPNLGIAL